jgi:glycosyltransferase involved in cell wall biosynthesis
MPQKYKILTIVYDLEIGGTQRAAQNFSIAYHQAGHDSRVLPIYSDGPRKAEILKSGLSVYDSGDQLEYSLKKIEEWDPEIIHIHRSGEYDAFLGNILRSLRSNSRKIIETNVFSVVDHSVDSQLIDVHCHLSLWCLWRWNILLKNKALGIVVPYLVIPDKFYAEKVDKILQYKIENNIPVNKFIFGRIGQKSPAKFNKEIYLAFDKLFLELQDIHLVIVGLPDRHLEEVSHLKSYKEGGITLIEKIIGDDELRLAYNSFNCFLHYSSIGESFGMVLAEAQLCEVPVISVSTPKVDNSQLEVLIYPESSFIVKNAKDLKMIMQQAVESKYSLSKMGSVGRKHVLDNFTSQKLIPKLNLLFQTLLSTSDPQFEIANLFTSNVRAVSIDKISNQGFGEYTFTSKAFLIAPRLYLFLSNGLYKIKKIVVGNHE